VCALEVTYCPFDSHVQLYRSQMCKLQYLQCLYTTHCYINTICVLSAFTQHTMPCLSYVKYRQRYIRKFSVWLQTGRTRLDPWERQRIITQSSVSRPALEPTQPPVQWVPGVISLGLNRERATLIIHPHLLPKPIR
jgi:hypothetical protein